MTTTTAAPATTASDSQWSEEQLEVIEAFEAAELAFRRARMDPVDPQSAELRRTHTTGALGAAIGKLDERIRQGRATRWPNGVALVAVYELIAVNGDFAEIEGCQFDDGVLYEVATDAVVNDEIVAVDMRATLLRCEGEWLLDSFTFGDDRGLQC
ncbi:MAG: hypothetical protein P8N02_07160 [Actinomycetota bacterium]|nr:hypothetical protein [Actinomycetota bacterium]